jgi:hypothetical protein
MIPMPFINDDEPMCDNYEYGYFPDNFDHGEMVFDGN